MIGAYVSEHLGHAYAITGHSSQGATVEAAIVVGRPEEFTKEWAYTVLSRARSETTMHLITDHGPDIAERSEYAPAALVRNPQTSSRRSAGDATRQQRASRDRASAPPTCDRCARRFPEPPPMVRAATPTRPERRSPPTTGTPAGCRSRSRNRQLTTAPPVPQIKEQRFASHNRSAAQTIRAPRRQGQLQRNIDRPLDGGRATSGSSLAWTAASPGGSCSLPSESRPLLLARRRCLSTVLLSVEGRPSAGDRNQRRSLDPATILTVPSRAAGTAIGPVVGHDRS